MSKNRNRVPYSEYSKYGKSEEMVEEVVKEEPVVEEKVEEVAVPEVKEEKKDLGLETNVLSDPVVYGVIDCERLNVRREPKTGDNIIGVYNKGTKVTILKDLGEWYSVELEKNSVRVRGFAMSKFIKKN